MINKLQELEVKTKLKFYKNISNHYDNTNITTDEDLFSKNAQGISKLYHEVSLLLNFLQTKPQVKNMSFNCYYLYYTVTKNTDEKQVVDDQYEDNENVYFNFSDFITPKHKPC